MSEKNTMAPAEDAARVQNVVKGTSKTLDEIGVEMLTVSTDLKTVHAKRIGGFFRQVKNVSAFLWLSFFLLPYVRWDDRQALLFDLPNRQFHIFGITILPQDIWMLASILLFAAMALAAASALAGRVWCGYFCFQTVWMDVFTWIEEKIQGGPNKRMALDQSPWTAEKLRLKGATNAVFLLLSFLTGFSFVAYFTDSLQLWQDLFAGNIGGFAWWAIAGLTITTFLFASKLREQTCTLFCPYSRIQGAMIDKQTIVPTYDLDRGEPRGRMKRVRPGEEEPKLGDCIDCNLCVAVCPTGVDIRKGQQIGCITCGLCIDACDSVMKKLDKPLGLIRYASLEEFEGKVLPPLYKRPRVIVYTGIMAVAASVLIYGLATIAPLKLNVLHERSPLFVMLSDGTIQNKLTIKVVNKTDKVMMVNLSASGINGLRVEGNDAPLQVAPGSVGATTLLVKADKQALSGANTPLLIEAVDINNPAIRQKYDSMFVGPK